MIKKVEGKLPPLMDDTRANYLARIDRKEALYALGEGLFFGEIVPVLKETFPTFDTIFGEIKDQRGRKRFQMADGRKGFVHPDLPKILQTIDKLAKQKYDELAKCFFEFDIKSNQFVIKQDESTRYQLLPRESRLCNEKSQF